MVSLKAQEMNDRVTEKSVLSYNTATINSRDATKLCESPGENMGK